ncbi:hypothetical protein C6P46_002909 [Rhodotorula mucilaginosa]|uniref:Cytochrome b561 domain-containing protein n=1 Tax=Rhodotorula mucilaginosa TaxID=5537 RepID=A0A9P7B7V8_RHOMI|nr:hypothetical protein C6P46_002909 [Rhodotorula mucilaginosa]TKA53339.1 hypothetical protein B0A53_04357 [Rhodotorula sp. CCFEE 5036]
MPVPPAGATQTANHIDAVEDTPLLHDSRDPAETDTDRMVQPPNPSAVEVIAGNSFTGPTGWAAQVGLVVATVVLWRVLWVHPAGLFTYHPALQSLAALGFLEGILLLQPQPASAQRKRKGLQIHQVFQYASLVAIVGGAAVIIYNKAIHGAKHFTSWHAISGLITLGLIFTQIIFGAVIVYTPLQTTFFKSETAAKQLWKYHRMSGYLTLTFLTLTPLLALASDWVRNNSTAVERGLIGGGLGVAAVAAFARVQTSKLGFKRR